LEGKWHQ